MLRQTGTLAADFEVLVLTGAGLHVTSLHVHQNWQASYFR